MIKNILSLFLFSILSIGLTAEDHDLSKVDAKALVTKADLLIRGESSSIQYSTFTVIRPGSTVEREFISYLKGKPFSFTHFLKPMADRNITFLKRDYDLWTYSPKVRKEIRIPVTMMHEGIMGSDYTYDDMVKASTLADDYDPKIVGVSKEMEKAHGRVYVLDLTPLPGKPIAYKKLRLWIREEGTIILRQQYYDDNGQVTRVQEYSEIKEIGKRVIPTRYEMFDATKQGHSTVMVVKNAEFNTLESEDIFAQRSLDNPPKPTWGDRKSVV